MSGLYRRDVVSGIAFMVFVLVAIFGFLLFALRSVEMPPKPGECKVLVKQKAERHGDTLFHVRDTTFWCAK